MYVRIFKFVLQINVKDLSFRTYTEVSELEADEIRDLFPPRFIINITCRNRNCILHAQCKVSCFDKNESVIFDDLIFNIIIPPRRFLGASSCSVESE